MRQENKDRASLGKVLNYRGQKVTKSPLFTRMQVKGPYTALPLSEEITKVNTKTILLTAFLFFNITKSYCNELISKLDGHLRPRSV